MDKRDENAGRRQREAAPASTGEVRPARVYLMSALVSAMTALIAAGLFLAGFGAHALIEDGDGGGAQAPGAPAQAAEPTPAGPIEVSVGDDPAFGPEGAAVTIVEFSDFQCPFCARFSEETLPQIRSTYGDKVRFVFRDFPLTNIHAQAQKASEASECADEQGKFWEYHDKLFENQEALDQASLKQYASDMGLDTGAFNDCLDSDKYADEVQADLEDGISYGVTGTPTFFINGEKVVGAQPFSAFQQVIDAELSEAGE